MQTAASNRTAASGDSQSSKIGYVTYFAKVNAITAWLVG